MKSSYIRYIIYSGASLQRTSWRWVLLFIIQWSLPTKDKLEMGPFVHYTVEPPYKGQVGDGSFCSLYSGASLQRTSWRWVLLFIIQWSLPTKDKLEMGPFVHYTVEPPYKLGTTAGSFTGGGGPFVLCTVSVIPCS